MIRAALKSLLGRKVRLLLSTFAIVLGVAFVAGTLIFSDTLNRSFTALFASTVGDVVVQPVGAQTEGGTPSSQTLPASLLDELEQVDGVARVDGNVNAFGVYVVGSDGKLIGGLGPPSIGGNWTNAPVARRRRPRGRRRRGAAGPARGACSTSAPPRRPATRSATRSRCCCPAGTAQFEAELVGILGYPEGGSLNGATLTLFDTPSAQELFLDGEDVYNDVWVTAEDGVSQEELRDAVAPGAAQRRRGRDRRRGGRRRGRRAARGDRLHHHVPAGLRRHRPGRRRVHHRQHVLDPGRAAQPRARAAARPRRLAAAGDLVGAARGVRARAARLHDRPRARRAAGDGAARPVRPVRPRPVRAAAGVRAAHRRRVVRRGRARHHGGGVLPGPPGRPDRAGAGAAATTSRCPRPSIRRRLVFGVLLAAVGLVSLVFGLVLDVPKPLAFVGAGVLGVLLGVASASPVISRPLLRLARGGLPAAVRHRRQAGRRELAAQPAAHRGDRLGADDRPGARRDDGRHRRLGQGLDRRGHRGRVRRRLRRVQRVRRRVQHRHRRRDGRRRGRGRGRPDALPVPARRRRPVLRHGARPLGRRAAGAEGPRGHRRRCGTGRCWSRSPTPTRRASRSATTSTSRCPRASSRGRSSASSRTPRSSSPAPSRPSPRSTRPASSRPTTR